MHINDTGRTNLYQSAYKQFHNTETAVLNILDDIYAIVDDKKSNMPCCIGFIGSI